MKPTYRRTPHSNVADRILHEDNHLIIVNKEAGELVQGDKTGDKTLGDAVKAYLKKKYNKPGDVFLGVIHRLDRPTTGAVMFARTSKALTRMANAFRDREVEKTYWALVERQPKEDSGTLTHWLFKEREKNKVAVYKKPNRDAKKAILHYEVIARVTEHYMIQVKLETGRPHQIRAQLGSIGCPIVGDKKYGYPRLMKDKGIALHSRILAFNHPTTKERLRILAHKPNLQIWNKFG